MGHHCCKPTESKEHEVFIDSPASSEVAEEEAKAPLEIEVVITMGNVNAETDFLNIPNLPLSTTIGELKEKIAHVDPRLAASDMNLRWTGISLENELTLGSYGIK